jgi:hypothetical protein
LQVSSGIRVIVAAILVVAVLSTNRSQSQESKRIPASAQSTDPTVKPPLSRSDYIGDQACQACHKEKVEMFHQTAHYVTSRLPGDDAIAGKFNPESNILRTSNPDLFFRMEASEKGYFQTAVQGTPPAATTRTERFDLVTGSGRIGQTYLYWKRDQLFQMPVSYWTELGQWINSPGYQDGTAFFDRPVTPRCLECHSTYFESASPPENRYNTTGFLLGITCEKCHGPGREHVNHSQSNSNSQAKQAIVNPAALTRDRQIDVCALCHAGAGKPLVPSFSYRPGGILANYVRLPRAEPNVNLDVHGSQVELLKKSRCFQSSQMTCSTCHDVHVPQHDLTALSQRCLTCHKAENCGVYEKRGLQIVNNCIDCHMRKQQSNSIVADSNGRNMKPQVRDHWIRIYAGTLTE